MKISLNWVQEFTKVNITPEKLCELLSLKLSEVANFKKLKSQDVVIEIENKALTHRGDCFCIEGLAREISAITKSPCNLPNYENTKEESTEKNISINVENNTDCPRYKIVKIKNIKIENSPKEIQEKLINSDIRPINNFVDFTNYVMLETGQPLHAFDAKKLISKEGKYNLGVRRARKGEVLVTLDDIKRTLIENLVITNYDNPIALAGVMGGKETEVDENTTEIILEGANFNNFATRKSSKTLGLRTEASLRFEKNLDPNTVDRGIGKFINLINKYNCGQVEEICDYYPDKQNPVVIEINIDFINNTLGTALDFKSISQILESLFFKVENTTENSKEIFKVIVPTFRKDIGIKEDLVEEIARIYGYENITPKLPTKSLKPTVLDPKLNFFRKVKELLKNLGYVEIFSYSFVGENMYKRANLSTDTLLEIINPLSPQLKFMRNNLLPSMLEKVDFNKNNFTNFKIFELGKELQKSKGTKELNEGLPTETYTLCIACYNKEELDLETLFRQSKGDVEFLLNNFSSAPKNIDPVFIEPNLVVYKIDLEELFKDTLNYQKEIKDVPPYPPIMENVSFYLNKESKIGIIINKIKEINPLVAEVEIEDMYKTNERKSITLKITYQDMKKSLSTQEITPIRKSIITMLEKEMGLEIRG